jgi:hypothetical protein
MARPIDDRLRWSFEICAAKDPWTVGKRVDGVNLPAFGGEPQRKTAITSAD